MDACAFGVLVFAAIVLFLVVVGAAAVAFGYHTTLLLLRHVPGLWRRL